MEAPPSNKKYVLSLFEGITFFTASVFIAHFASEYAEVRASNSVDDIILSNIPVINFEIVFVQGAIALLLLVLALILRHPRTAPFVLKSSALFIFIRSIFVSLTHIGPYPTHLDITSHLLDFITTGNDLFFSGHTGLPFLIALIYWNHPIIRNTFLIASVLFGVIVLLSHLHYSIDVFAAFFITYAIYHISVTFFKKDLEFFRLSA